MTTFRADLATATTTLESLSPRRLLLMESAATVIASDGIRGLTHRAVDRRAGLPEGSCSAYLRTSRALRLALTEYVAASLQAEIARLLARLEDHGPQPRSTEQGLVDLLRETTMMLAGWLEERTLVVAKQELTTAAAHDPELAAIIAGVRAQMVAVVEVILTACGQPRGLERAEALVAAGDGILGTSLLLPEEQRLGYLTRSMALVATGVVSL